MCTLARLNTLVAKHRGGWETLRSYRQSHWDTLERFREHKSRVARALYYPEPETTLESQLEASLNAIGILVPVFGNHSQPEN